MALDLSSLPLKIDTGLWDTGHIQGITLDTKHEYIYYSFTTTLVKADLSGNVIGSVKGLTGHLGCIDFNDEDGKVYGSIEYKHDTIGKGIMAHTGVKLAEEDAFYIAIFDVDKIDKLNMDAERDGVMTAVYLPEVVADYSAEVAPGKPHRLCCSGIDGTGFGPAFGQPQDSKTMLMIAYGIYGDVNRSDNDYQVILAFDWRKFASAAQPLVQGEPHHAGLLAENRYFLYTGNTNWGIQNLEYDATNEVWLAAVYRGKKPQFPNRALYMIDATKSPVKMPLRGVEPYEEGLVLSLKEAGEYDAASGVYGWEFPLGATGIYSLGENYFYFSKNRSVPVNGGSYKLQTAKILLCRYTGEAPDGFTVLESK